MFCSFVKWREDELGNDLDEQFVIEAIHLQMVSSTVNWGISCPNFGILNFRRFLCNKKSMKIRHAQNVKTECFRSIFIHDTIQKREKCTLLTTSCKM